MNIGKTIKLDPRSAPDKAPDVAPAITEKQMPEYPMDKNELIYPGQGSPFPVSDPKSVADAVPHGTAPPPARKEPPTEVPRNKMHLSAMESMPLLEVLRDCMGSCEACIRACEQTMDPHKLSACLVTCRAAADICRLLESYVTSLGKANLSALTTDLAMVCARVCEACAVECGKHPQLPHCVACEKSCRAAAEACRSFAD